VFHWPVVHFCCLNDIFCAFLLPLLVPLYFLKREHAYKSEPLIVADHNVPFQCTVCVKKVCPIVVCHFLGNHLELLREIFRAVELTR